MIKTEHRLKCKCDNCKRIMSFCLKYSFSEPEIEITLCDDCSNALKTLKLACIQEETSCVYDNDEITLNEREVFKNGITNN